MFARPNLKTCAFIIAAFSVALVITPTVHGQGGGTQSASLRSSGPDISLPRKINPGLTINSRYEETKPMLSPDGKRLYFARKHASSNIGGLADPQDIYCSEIVNGKQWSPARNPGSLINTRHADNLCAVPDENTFVFFVPSGKHKGQFVIRRQSPSGFTTEALTGPIVVNESEYLEGTFSVDGRVLLFTARTKANLFYRKGQDERDIYFSLKKGDKWTEPVNAGTMLSSAGDEYSPFLCADGRTLYFATNGRGGFGGVDIFMTRRIGNGWDTWTEPVNLGPEINSGKFDGYFTVAMNSPLAYMVSYSHTFGKSDIVSVLLPPEMQPLPSLKLNIIVKDATSGTPVPATIVFRTKDGAKISEGIISSPHGAHTIVTPQSEVITAEARLDGFKPCQVDISSKAADDTIIIFLQRADNVNDVTLRDLLFVKGTDRLTEPSHPTLDSLLNFMQLFPGACIELEGHTDNIGNMSDLKDLSSRRVASIKSYLIKQGIAPDRISGKGFGGLKPLLANDNEQNRARNRRVKVIIKK
jgi:outer membrane protein OmpA-like peptidoglycan-associated protein